MKKQIFTDKNGITLIALVVTIVVLLILAGVSISMLTGENGIITQAKDSKENTRGGEVKERVDLEVAANDIAKNTNGEKKSKDKVIDELEKEGLLTQKEVDKLAEEDKITIGKIEIDFSRLNNSENSEEPENTEIGEITVTNGNYTLQVGDYINYSPTDGAEVTTQKSSKSQNGYGDQEFSSNYTGKWRVLGVDEKNKY